MAIASFNRQASKDEMAREIDRCHAVIEKYEAEASRSPVSQKEAVPVAWRWRYSEDADWFFAVSDQRCPDWAEPLYASPAPAGEPGIKALSDHIRRLVEDTLVAVRFGQDPVDNERHLARVAAERFSEFLTHSARPVAWTNSHQLARPGDGAGYSKPAAPVGRPLVDIDELSKGKARPISIWNEGQARAYYEATEEVRAAWNRYAQAEANIFDNNPNLDSYDSVHTHTGYDKEAGRVTPWAPPLTFKEFAALRSPTVEGK